MARGFYIVWAGRNRRGPWETLCADYRGRIARFVPVDDRPVRAKTSADDPARQRREGDALVAALPDPCWTFALDARGKGLGSEALAAELQTLEREWPHAIAFVIGSDLGLDQRVRASARRILSFGAMTFGHELARLMLYEQLYRAVAQSKGIKYHRPSL